MAKKNDPITEQDVGFANVAFVDDDGRRIVATVIGYDDGDTRVCNPRWDNAWHLKQDQVTRTDEPLNEPPADY